MQLIINKKIGNTVYPFMVEGANLFELVQESQKLSFQDVDKCGLCGSTNLYLSSHIAQGKYKYTHINCAACSAQLVFGQRKDSPETFFLRRNDKKALDWQPYKDANGEPDQPPPAAQQEYGPPAGSPPHQANQAPAGQKRYSVTYINLVDRVNKVDSYKGYEDMANELYSAKQARHISEEEWSSAMAALNAVANRNGIKG